LAESIQLVVSEDFRGKRHEHALKVIEQPSFPAALSLSVSAVARMN
jgi:hypothetical protein